MKTYEKIIFKLDTYSWEVISGSDCQTKNKILLLHGPVCAFMDSIQVEKGREDNLYHICNQTSDKQRLEILETENAIEKLWNLKKCVPAWA